MLYKSRVYELQRALDHAEGRFKDLQPVELVAKSFEVFTLDFIEILIFFFAGLITDHGETEIPRG